MHINRDQEAQPIKSHDSSLCITIYPIYLERTDADNHLKGLS